MPKEDLESTIEKTLASMATSQKLTKHHMKKLKVISEAIKFLFLKAKKRDNDWGAGLKDDQEKGEQKSRGKTKVKI